MGIYQKGESAVEFGMKIQDFREMRGMKVEEYGQCIGQRTI